MYQKRIFDIIGKNDTYKQLTCTTMSFWKLPWNFYERSLKHWNFPWNLLKVTFETFLNHMWNTLETPLKFPWRTHETFLKHLATSVKLFWYFHNTSLKYSWNILEISMKHPGIYLKPSGNSIEIALKLLWSWLQTPLQTLLKHPLNCLDSLLKCSQHTPETSLKHTKNVFATH